MKEKEKFYITTAITYTSRKPHVGNTYEIVFTDAIARYNRALGKDVFFLTGTDEHGIKIQELAEKAGVSPKEYVDRVAGEVRGIWDLMNTSYDKFIRTTDEQHERVVSHIFKKLYDSGDIYKGTYTGWYCTPCETFFTDSQLVDGKCPDCGAPVQKANEEAYFFKMSKYQKWLEEYIEEHPDFMAPESRRKEMINNFIKPGLNDLCVSRTSFTWGVPVSFDQKHVIYVWIDALSNYITALGYDVDEKGELYKKYWPCDVHIIGKDIMRFHTIIWPIILKALGEPLPKQIFGHPWFLNGIDKMSKSKGNTIYADELADIVGVDGVRYYLLCEMPYANDGTITYENVIKRYNADLANTLGNLVSRTVAMTKKYFGGTVPEDACREALDDELKTLAAETCAQVTALMKEYRAQEALEKIFTLLSRANKYIDETCPWILAKEESTLPRLKSVIYNLLEVIRFSAVLLTPFITASAEKILSVFGLEGREILFENDAVYGLLESGTELRDCGILFARIDEEKTLKEIHEANLKKLAEKQKAENPAAKMPDEITIDDFAKVALRVAEVKECAPVKKSDKLLCLQLDLGYEQRQVVSGIAKFYKPEELTGKKVILVANLKPVKLRGVDSNGMILASGYTAPDGSEKVNVIFADPSAENGSEVR
ncbi:MAG: methionine--tRNA ligase [Firmicutes bacterium]|nr:methionine--tRNA ligase [Bacillota bacterium]